ncbi:MAG TPA: hemolysin family protein [Solirubrobacteraceae bacterium]|nr:hemolysin family protein [Solirubrobacteraceae bacterium]
MTALLLIAVFGLVLINAFFVIAEYSLVRSRRPKLEAAKDEGLRGAALALEQLDHINEYISACQVGITLTSIGIGAVGEPVVANLLEPVLGGPLAHGAAVAISVIVAYLLITSVHITIGELVPKLYAIEHADRLVRLVARPLRVSRLVFAPFISALTFISNRILRLLGVDPDTINEQAENPEELKLIITESLQGGQLDPGEAGMLRGVFHLHEQEARQVMTPIPAVVTVDVSVDVKTALERCITTGHTRLLVIEDENPDRVRGIVHASRLARALMEAGEHAPIEPLVRDAPIVPETKPLDDLLAELQRERTEMAVVVDEYGRVAGIITLEDIIEEVVGEIEDETDPAGGAVRRLANGDWYVRGEVAITDLVDYGLELPLDTDAYNSVGGFVFAALGRLPRRGDTVTANGYSIRVESVRENRIEAVRIRERTPT